MGDGRDSRFLFVDHRVDDGLARGLSLGLLYSHRANGMAEGSGIGRNTMPNNRYYFPQEHTAWTMVIPYAKFERNLSSSVKFSGYWSYNRSTEEGEYLFPPTETLDGITYRSLTEAHELQGEIQAQLAPKTHLIIGINYDGRRERGQPESWFETQLGGISTRSRGLFPSTTPWFRDIAAYAQLGHQFDWLAGTHLTAGFRYVKVEATNLESNNISPRVSIVQRLSDAWAMRLMWNSAFRSPNIKEFGLNLERQRRLAIPGGIPLEPEVFTTYEWGLGYTRPDLDIQLSAYFNELRDAIERSVIFARNSRTNAFVNVKDKTRSWGGELAVIMRIDDTWSASAKYAYNRPTGADKEGLAQLLPRYSGSLAVTYSDHLWGRPFSAAAIARWAHDFSAFSDSRQDVSSQFTTDVNLRLSLSRETSIELQVKNLLDRENRTSLADDIGIPEPGRSIMGSVVVSFDD